MKKNSTSSLTEEELEKKRGYKIISIEDKFSHYRQFIKKDGTPVNVPVIDVRDGIAERMLAESMRKSVNRSKYIPFSVYNVSQKKVHDTSL